MLTLTYVDNNDMAGHTHTHTSAEGSVQRQCGHRTQAGKHLRKRSGREPQTWMHTNTRMRFHAPDGGKDGQSHTGLWSVRHTYTLLTPALPPPRLLQTPFLSSSTLFKALPLVRHLSSHSIMLLLDEFSFPHSLSLLHFCVLFQLLCSEHMHDVHV